MRDPTIKKLFSVRNVNALKNEVNESSRLSKLPELNPLDTTRISNGTNFPSLALLYRQNFLRVPGFNNASITTKVGNKNHKSWK